MAIDRLRRRRVSLSIPRLCKLHFRFVLHVSPSSNRLSLDNVVQAKDAQTSGVASLLLSPPLSPSRDSAKKIHGNIRLRQFLSVHIGFLR